jgi:crotonobetainyl-CoA:carnitine CoA-transferase CaiB-like acyl-CoA transferase
MIGVGNDAQWRRFCPVAGLDDVIDAPKFATNAARVAHFDETVAMVQARMRCSQSRTGSRHCARRAWLALPFIRSATPWRISRLQHAS